MTIDELHLLNSSIVILQSSIAIGRTHETFLDSRRRGVAGSKWCGASGSRRQGAVRQGAMALVVVECPGRSQTHRQTRPVRLERVLVRALSHDGSKHLDECQNRQ